jgi:hypothetical protein
MPISIVGGFAEPIASWKRSVGSPRGVDDQVRRETSRPSPRVLEAHPGNRAVVGRGGQFRHTRARPELNIGLALDAATADAIQRGARQAELIETEVALRKRIETRNLEAHVAANAHPNGAGLDEIELDAWKQMPERAAPARKEPVRVPRLRRAGARRGHIGKASRSNTVTFSKWGATAFAAARPPIPAPMTTACFRIGLDIESLLSNAAWRRNFRPAAKPSERRAR